MPRARSRNPQRNVLGDRERVWLGGARGKYYYLPGRIGSKENDAEYARLLASAAADPHGVPVGADDDFLLELIADWLASDASPPGKSERAEVKSIVEQLKQHHLVTGVKEFDAMMLAEWQRWLCSLTRPDGQSRYTSAGVAARVNWIRKVYSWGVVQGRVTEAHAASLERVEPPRRGILRRPQRRPAVPLEAVSATMLKLPVIVADLLAVILETAARPDEIYKLRPCDIQQTGIVVLPSGAEVEIDPHGLWAYVPEKHKMTGRDKDRCILLGPAAKSILAKYLDRPPTSFCFSPRESYDAAHDRQAEQRRPGSAGNRKPQSQRQEKRPRGHYDSASVNQAIERAAAKAGVPRWTAYQLRKRATVELRKRHGAEITAAIAGHSVATLESWYAPPSVAAAAKAIGSSAER